MSEMRRIIARRELVDAHTHERIGVAVFEPERETTSEFEEWRCDVEFSRENVVLSRYSGHGIDSLQSIVTAVAALRSKVAELGGREGVQRFCWVSEQGELGLPVVVQDENPVFLDLIEHLLAAETCRELLGRTRAAKK